VSDVFQIRLWLSSAILIGQLASAQAIVEVGVGEGRSPLSTHSILSANLSGSASLRPDPSVFFPSYPSFNSQRLDQQLNLYRQYLGYFGRPDILIVGSSRSLQGIDPTALRETLVAQGYPDLQIYNFGVNGATAQVVDLILRHILSPEQLPRLIIWADGSRAFNSGRQDITYNGIVTSAGYRRLNTGDRPIPTLEPLPTNPSEVCIDLPTHWIVGSQNLTDSHPAILPADYTKLHLWSHRLSCDASEQTAKVPPDTEVDSTPIISHTAPHPISSELDNTGFQAVSTEFNPTTYYSQFPRVAGQYDSNYVPFDLGGEQNRAAIALLHYLRQQQIPIVFINLPLSQDYLDSVRQRYEQEFQRYLQRLAEQEGLMVRDLLNQPAIPNHYFADPSHLNHHGAQAIAQQLATDPGIPWEILR
jgi:hypothetical protein